ncbi:hypothetical protein G6L37_04885 [Agrobacterium rubi]|nr:hypothetical protein [Agrobacterium rubi]NTF24690.1 hypothetical protein [Agrobacterium rubi]
MTDNKSRRVGVINFVGQIEIPSENVTVAVKSNIATIGRHLLIDLKGIRDLPIPPSALLSVEIKDNILNEPTNHGFKTWAEIDRSMTVRAPVDTTFNARRTSIRILFVDPVVGSIIAGTPLLHASDDTGELQNSGESYIKFRREPTNTLPAKPCINHEGPLIEFGADGPVDVAASENDLGFVQYGLPAAIRQFTASMLLAEDGYDTDRWKKFKADAADWAGFEGDWSAMRKDFTSSDQPELSLEELCNKTISGLMNHRVFKDNLKRLVKHTANEQNIIDEEYQNVA